MPIDPKSVIWDAPSKGDSFDAALAAEGVKGPVAEIARSIYQQESSSGKNAKTSNAGAVGGMQIIPGTFKSVADKDWDINDPTQNARAGIRYVKQLYEQAGGDPALTAAGYYGGPGGLEKARRGVAVADPRNPGAPTTLQYGQQVAARIPKEKGLIQRGVEAMIPSAEAGERIDPAAAQWEAPAKAAIDPKAVIWDTPTKSAESPGIIDTLRGYGQAAQQATKDLGLGAIRGAGSIGATLVAPYDIAKDAIDGKGLSLESNRQRRTEMDAGLRELGANTDSIAFQGGKLAGEVAGTAGVGGALGQGAQALGAAPKLVSALSSGGMSLGGAPATTLTQGAGNLALRAAGGAVTGGVSAGLVNPEEAGAGAAIGAAVPVAARGVAAVGRNVGDRMATAAAEKAADLSRRQPLFDTLRDGLDAGYVVTPSSVKPSLLNTVKESTSGKIATAQVASSKNQVVTDKLVRQSLGLADDAPLSVEALSKYRADMHAAGYEPLRQIGMVQAGPQFTNDLDQVVRQYTGKGTIPAIQKSEIADLVAAHKSAQFDSGDAVDAIRILRDDANDAFRKGDSALGKAQKAIANAYEAALENSLPQGSDVLKNYQTARQNIAKSFTVEDALKEGTGSVDARKLAAALQKGEPLSGELLTAARFASAFRKATQPPELVAGAAVHNLKAGASAGGAALGAMAGGPVGAAAMALGPWVAPPLLRAQMFSKGAQNALIPQAGGNGNALLQFAQSPQVSELAQLFQRAAPVLGTQ